MIAAGGTRRDTRSLREEAMVDHRAGTTRDVLGLDVVVGRTDSTAIVYVLGELDLATSRNLEGELLRLISGGWCRRLVLDLSRLTFVDSTGLRSLVTMRHRAQSSGISMSLSSPSEPVMRVLRVAKLDAVLHLLTETDPDEIASADI
jgi:anti-sigma B factor antagonist